MSSKINAREVLSYLNQLGYTNVNALQLQAFIKDLKKLMKFEELKNIQPSSDEAKLVEINIMGQSTRKLGESKQTWTDALFRKKNEQNVFHSESQLKLIEGKNIPEYNSSLERPITVPTLTNQKKTDQPMGDFLQTSSNSTIVCPVHYYRGLDSSKAPEHKTHKISCNCPIDALSNFSRSHVSDKNTRKGKRPVSSTIESKNDIGTSSYLENINDYPKHSLHKKKARKSTGTCTSNHDFTCPCYCLESDKPRSAVIKCRTGCVPPFQKCDPVNLHKYYQRQWKINKIPGENISRDKRFRWCFRERISCGPPAKNRFT